MTDPKWASAETLPCVTECHVGLLNVRILVIRVMRVYGTSWIRVVT